MALSQIKKIRLIASSKHRDKILEQLQNISDMEILSDEGNTRIALTKKSLNKLEDLELSKANIEFSIRTLEKFEKKSLFQNPIKISLEDAKEQGENYNFSEITKESQKFEDKTSKAKNDIETINQKISDFSPFIDLPFSLEELNGTEETKVKVGEAKIETLETLKEGIKDLSKNIEFQTIAETEKHFYFYIIFDKKLETDINHLLSEIKFEDAKLPIEKETLKEYMHALRSDLKEAKRSIKDNEKNIKKHLKELPKLKIAYDYYSWEIEKMASLRKIEKTDYSFCITAWVPKTSLDKLENEVSKVTTEYTMEILQLEEGEIPPVTIKNPSFMQPFEAVTKTYGLPLYSELDPTPYLAFFFVLYFALCLTDAGYGIVMLILLATVLKVFNFDKGMKNLVTVLLYGSIVTVIMGTLFGGWFGLTTDQVPSFFSYTDANGERMFLLQKINPITNPLNVLILSFGLGYVQILFGTLIKFFHTLKNGDKTSALLDTLPWSFFLTGLGFFILSTTEVITPALTVITKYWVYAGLIGLVLTQGREKKSIIGKAISGVLSLYGLVGYLSDVLSYSRLLALGLATAIIGMAVNTIAFLLKDMVPYLGYILMAIVFVVGHTLNLLINALGAFIHSGRLQFVEFFGKFMEGGGKEFKPLSKKSKYIYLTKS